MSSIEGVEADAQDQAAPLNAPISDSSQSSYKPSSLEVPTSHHRQANPSPSRPAAPKRKTLRAHRQQPQAKRARITPPKHSEEYRQLLNATIQDACTGAPTCLTGEEQEDKDSRNPLPASQIGASYWTSEEKEAFFKALPVLGRDDVQGIAARIKTKSSLEVTLYLRLLQRAMLDRYLHEPAHRLLGLIDMPAAVEISTGCCDRLDQLAAALEARQAQEEESRERRRWDDDRWILTPETGGWVESKLAEGVEGVNEVVSKLPAARLLKLESWLELSERIFMNPAPPREDENWRCISAGTEEEEWPSIRATAFTDFASLAVGITERLVQTTLFQARSRCRAIDARHFARGYSVQVRDVHAACRVLGLELNARRFWRSAARRCGLDVYRHVSEMKSQSAEDGLPMAYEEIEEVLLGEKKSKSTAGSSIELEEEGTIKTEEAQSRFKKPRPMRKSERSRPTTTTASSPEISSSSSPTKSSSSGLHPTDSSSESTIDISESDDDDTDKPYSREARVVAKWHRQRELHRAQDAYMEALDRRNSSVEEDRLWRQILGQERPRGEEDGEMKLPAQPARDRKLAADLIDWRDRTEYWAEWETLLLKGRIGDDVVSRPRQGGGREKKVSADAGRLRSSFKVEGEEEVDSDGGDEEEEDGSDASSAGTDTTSTITASQGDDGTSVVSDGDGFADSDDDVETDTLDEEGSEEVNAEGSRVQES
ncbi:MAG: hypothetical protein M1816_006302 [Peltula sp. TS41687]|nr:MAG: hypothetical protein M1816_006302 [Peltula sp. TS41687]